MILDRLIFLTRISTGCFFYHREGLPHRERGPHRGQLPARQRDGLGGRKGGVGHVVPGCHRDAQGPDQGGRHHLLQGKPLCRHIVVAGVWTRNEMTGKITALCDIVKVLIVLEA